MDNNELIDLLDERVLSLIRYANAVDTKSQVAEIRFLNDNKTSILEELEDSNG